ncbi:MAG TPA: hypothetical protein VFE46_11125 [Pirellulales bacterium]|jgi:hypothetical protein|nr:hypothetical protein [Pirellulales bacterium]
MKRQVFSTGGVLSGALFCTMAGLLALALSGCDEIDQMADNAAKRPVTQNFTPGMDNDPEQRQHASNNTPANATPPANNTAQNAAAPPTTDPNAPTTMKPGDEKDPTLQKAEAGVGKQGSGYGGGLITEPVHEFFVGRDKITFEIQIPHQLQLWKAENNNRNPKNFEEYKRVILDPCGVDLPELPPGKRYLYDPKTGDLLVASGGQP